MNVKFYSFQCIKIYIILCNTFTNNYYMFYKYSNISFPSNEINNLYIDLKYIFTYLQTVLGGMNIQVL